jgi:hypothetical protein
MMFRSLGCCVVSGLRPYLQRMCVVGECMCVVGSSQCKPQSTALLDLWADVVAVFSALGEPNNEPIMSQTRPRLRIPNPQGPCCNRQVTHHWTACVMGWHQHKGRTCCITRAYWMPCAWQCEVFWMWNQASEWQCSFGVIICVLGSRRVSADWCRVDRSVFGDLSPVLGSTLNLPVVLHCRRPTTCECLVVV